MEGNFSNLASSVTKPVPVKPQGLKAVLEGNRVRLTWQPNPEKDITGYRIFQKSFFLIWEKVGESPGTEFLFQGELKKGKTLTFRITAVDQTQLEGEPSEELGLVIP